MNDMDILMFIIIEDLTERSVVRDEVKYYRKDYKDTMITDWAHIKYELDIYRRIIEYLLRIYYWSDLILESLDHWASYIHIYHHNIPRQRGRKNRFPSKKMIYKTICALFDDYNILNHNLKTNTAGIGYDKLPEVIVGEDGIEFCKKYLDWVSEKLSIYGKVEEYEVKGIINKLMNER